MATHLLLHSGLALGPEVQEGWEDGLPERAQPAAGVGGHRLREAIEGGQEVLQDLGVLLVAGREEEGGRGRSCDYHVTP